MSELPESEVSSIDGSNPTPARRFRRLVLLALIVAFLGLVAMATAAWMANRKQKEWTQRVEATGAKVIIAGYGRSGPLMKIPILRDLLVRRQSEVFLPDSDVARRAEPILHEATELGRIWVHIIGIDAEHRAQLEESFPDVQFVGYTNPGEG